MNAKGFKIISITNNMSFPRCWREVDVLSVIDRKRKQVERYHGEWAKVNLDSRYKDISIIGKLVYLPDDPDKFELHIGGGKKLDFPYRCLEKLEVGDDSLLENMDFSR